MQLAQDGSREEAVNLLSGLQPVLPSTNHINLTTTKIQKCPFRDLVTKIKENVCVAVNQAGATLTGKIK